MNRRRISILGALFKGVAVSVLITLAGMLIMAAAVIYLGMGHGLIHILNQLLKVLAVALGVLAAVRRGGQRGLVTGAGVGAVYALAGYLIYLALGGGEFDIVALLGELTLCLAAGGVAGAVCANLNPRHKAA